MLCPVCKDVRLEIAERKGIEIDYCPQCRGIWLDRGELDKIIERSIAELNRVAAEPPPPQLQPPTYASPPPEGPPPTPPPRGAHGRKPRRRKSFLSELFEELWD